jgi:hypothetical protein
MCILPSKEKLLKNIWFQHKCNITFDSLSLSITLQLILYDILQLDRCSCIYFFYVLGIPLVKNYRKDNVRMLVFVAQPFPQGYFKIVVVLQISNCTRIE